MLKQSDWAKITKHMRKASYKGHDFLAMRSGPNSPWKVEKIIWSTLPPRLFDFRKTVAVDVKTSELSEKVMAYVNSTNPAEPK